MPAGRPIIPWIVAGLAAWTGCQLGPVVFECRHDHQCERGVTGRCEDNGRCSYEDDACSETARRWSDYAGGVLAGACVTPEEIGLEDTTTTGGVSVAGTGESTNGSSEGEADPAGSSEATDGGSSSDTASACVPKSVRLPADRTFCRGDTVDEAACAEIAFARAMGALLVDSELGEAPGESVSIYLRFPPVSPDLEGLPWMNVRLVMTLSMEAELVEHAGQVWPANAFVDGERPACGGFVPLSDDAAAMGTRVEWPLIERAPVPDDDGNVYVCVKPTAEPGVVYLGSDALDAPHLLIEVCT